MCFYEPARTAPHEMWCTTATTTTTPTVPMRPLTCFDGLARAVVHEKWYKYYFEVLFYVPGS